MQRIADTGLLVGLLDRLDSHHSWAIEQFEQFSPFEVCEPVLSELAFILGDPRPGVRMLSLGDLNLSFSLAHHKERVLELLEKYRDLQMDLADACIVRMTELVDQCQVWTVDRADFRVYRRHGRQHIPCAFPSRGE